MIFETFVAIAQFANKDHLGAIAQIKKANPSAISESSHLLTPVGFLHKPSRPFKLCCQLGRSDIAVFSRSISGILIGCTENQQLQKRVTCCASVVCQRAYSSVITDSVLQFPGTLECHEGILSHDRFGKNYVETRL
jgi:hypothetical protein